MSGKEVLEKIVAAPVGSDVALTYAEHDAMRADLPQVFWPGLPTDKGRVFGRDWHVEDQ